MIIMNTTAHIIEPRQKGISVVLTPGTNEVDDDMWKILKKTRFVVKRLDNEQLIEEPVSRKKASKKSEPSGVEL